MPTNHLSSVREGYDRWAEVYDVDGNPLIALEQPRMKDTAGNVRNLSVLDLGCGTGRHSAWLAAAGANVTAVDFSPGMIARARQRPEAAALQFVFLDLAQPLPFPDHSFDLVVSGLVLEHIADLKHFFGEVHRMLRSAGRAAISAMHPAMFLRASQARFTDPLSGQKIEPGSVNHSVSDFVMSALHAGFRLEDVAEYAPDAALAARFPRADNYVGWPMLLMLKLSVSRYD